MNETEQRAQTEIVEESRETLEVLRLQRKPRPEKMALEAALLKDAHEVHFTERRVHLRDDIDAARAGVDKLVVERRALPEARPPPAPPALEPEPEPEPPQAELTKEERRALEKRATGRVVRVDTLYKTDAGHAVEVTLEDEGGARRTDSFIVRGGEVASIDDLGRVLDEMPLPESATEGAPEPAPAPAPSALPAPARQPEPAPEKKGRFGLGKKKDERAAKPAAPETPEPTPAVEASAPKEEGKRRFGFGNKKGETEEAAAAAPAPEKEAPAEAPAKKSRIGFGRKK